MRQPMQLVAVACATVSLLWACGGDDGATGAGSTVPGAADGSPALEPDLEGTVTVFAAASLTDAFEALGAAFEEANAGVRVTFGFGASSSLREQILAGAPADVYASADASDMEQVVEAGAGEEPVDFAAGELQLVVPAGNPAGVGGLADLARGELLVGLCAAEVPCGRLGREVLGNAGVAPAIDTNEPDVRSLLTKVEEGELDVGLVYRTDVLAAGDAVEGIDVPAGQNVTATYPITVLSEAGEVEIAEAFVAFARSREGQLVLASFGFERP